LEEFRKCHGIPGSSGKFLRITQFWGILEILQLENSGEFWGLKNKSERIPEIFGARCRIPQEFGGIPGFSGDSKGFRKKPEIF
jgi:hypothetical protein